MSDRLGGNQINTPHCAEIRCRQRGVVRVELDAAWPFRSVETVVVCYWLCRKHDAIATPSREFRMEGFLKR